MNRQTRFAFALVAAAFGVSGAKQTSVNLVLNGGFEKWGPLRPNVLQGESVKNLELIPQGMAPPCFGARQDANGAPHLRCPIRQVSRTRVID